MLSIALFQCFNIVCLSNSYMSWKSRDIKLEFLWNKATSPLPPIIWGVSSGTVWTKLPKGVSAASYWKFQLPTLLLLLLLLHLVMKKKRWSSLWYAQREGMYLGWGWIFFPYLLHYKRCIYGTLLTNSKCMSKFKFLVCLIMYWRIYFVYTPYFEHITITAFFHILLRSLLSKGSSNLELWREKFLGRLSRFSIELEWSLISHFSRFISSLIGGFLSGQDFRASLRALHLCKIFNLSC